MKLKKLEPAPNKELVAEYKTLEAWLERHNLKMNKLVRQGEDETSPRWQALQEEKAIKFKRYIELGKEIYNA